LITCEATYPSSASKSAASCNLQGKLQESGDQAKALQLELSNVKTELESAHSKAAADSTVRQKEIEDAKVAQLEDAKKIRELKEENQKLVGLKDQLQRLRQDNDNAKQEVVQMTVSRAYLSTFISTLRKKHRLSFNSAHHVVCDLARS
jgi:chromosome segregation ATPase